MSRRLFGTDGVRGAVGEVVTAELAFALGRAAAQELHVGDGPSAGILVIRDTRESGEMLEAALAEGIASAGGDVMLGGVLPTPAAPLLLARYGFGAAVVLSASHNPYSDNGIKFFGGDGFKLSDATEAAIERRLETGHAGPSPESNDRPADRVGRVQTLHGTAADYERELHSRFADLDLSGIDVLLDCANGATFEVGPAILARLGATVTTVAAAPDGRNINDGCGSTHVGEFAKQVAAGGHDIGFAFDGDGDRVLAADRAGAVVDGDELLALTALHLRASGRLSGDGVAVTVMTNYGFHTAMADAGIAVATTDVGDRYVLEALRERGWSLGGEQSGHIIDMGFNATGDGIAAALLVLEALAGGDLADRQAMRKLPQRLVNIPVADRNAAMASPELADATAREDGALAGRGRVLVRPSGTEQLVRVMVEAPTDDEADAVCDRLVAVVRAGA